MSVTGDIVDAVLVHIGTAAPTATTLRGSIPVDEIKQDELPHLQAWGEAMEVAEVLIFRQERQNHAFTVQITTRNQTQESMLVMLDAIIAQLATDPTLGDTVRWVNVPTWVLLGDPDKAESRKTLTFEVVAEVMA